MRKTGRNPNLRKYVIETLSGPPLIEIQQEQEEEDRVIEKVQRFQSAAATLPMDLKENLFKKNGRLIETLRANTPMAGNGKSGKFWVTTTPKKVDEGITIDHLHRLNQKNISAWNIKRLMHIVQKGTLSTLDEQLEGSRVYEEDESAVQITDEMQAKIAAKKIFINVAKQGSNSEHMEIDRVDVFRERKALALSLDDTKTVVAISKDNDYQKLKSKLQSTDDHDSSIICDIKVKLNYSVLEAMCDISHVIFHVYSFDTVVSYVICDIKVKLKYSPLEATYDISHVII
ncbi:hypothetical protein Tco_0654992 [Tanacetum coccineum]|uniref:Uncharacterized protein n=1 Tax=Tanacetum coccineum TaxID=301880 RepID=A0ABQ4X4R5_9ASTR